jgi:two-component system sensor histidine kinase TctE
VGQGWVEVEDNGPGIAEKHQPHVFERFYRAAPAGLPGSGLGLAIVREIALQHGARVSIRSPLLDGRGTAVRMAWD